jgi:hypothetical protein
MTMILKVLSWLYALAGIAAILGGIMLLGEKFWLAVLIIFGLWLVYQGYHIQHDK